MSKSLLDAFILKKPETEPGQIYHLVCEIVKDSKKVRIHTNSLNQVTYFECITAKHFLIREVQVYDN